MTRKATRSARQSQASRKNGAKGRGPTSREGKVRSAQNASKHGLTGKIDPTAAEQAEAEQLLAKLLARYSGRDPQQALLIDRVITATLRLNRARALVTIAVDQVAKAGDDWQEARRKRINEVVKEIQLLLETNYGFENPSRTVARFLAKQVGLLPSPSLPSRTSMSRLMQYARRFRGERDRALARLERIKRDAEANQALGNAKSADSGE